MALKDQPEFETMEDETFEQEAPQKAAAEASKAITKAASTSVGAAAKFKVAFAESNNVFDTTTVQGLSLAAPRIKGEQGSMAQGDLELGSKIHFELISFNQRWAMGCGDDKNKESKDYFRVSYDNVTLSGETTTIADYMESLKAQGFAHPNKEPYLDLWGFVTWSEKTGDISMDERQLACLQCSKTSMGAFAAFSTTRGLLESKGLVKPISVIEVHAEKRSKDTFKYTNFSFHVPKAK